MFANPDRFENQSDIAESAERYRLLKEEEQTFWEQWETLSLEAEDIKGQLADLDMAAAAG